MDENHNIIYSFLYKYHLDVEKWYDLAAIGLCKAAITYNNNKSGFSTYVYKCMYTTVIQEKRKEKVIRTIPQDLIYYYENKLNNNSDNDMSSYLNYIPSKEKFEDGILMNIRLDEIEKDLSKTSKLVFKLLRQGYLQHEIADIIGVSRQRISHIRKEIIEKYSIEMD